jgi:hypothetical protein
LVEQEEYETFLTNLNSFKGIEQVDYIDDLIINFV